MKWLHRMIARFLPIPRDDRPTPRTAKAERHREAMQQADRVIGEYRKLDGALQLWIGRRR